MIAGICLSLLFLSLSLLHWYWVVIGSGDLASFVPENEGKLAFKPGRWATASVAGFLLVAAFLCASQAQLLGLPRNQLSRIGVWVLLVTFMLRAVGEFRLVGFFKRVRETRFGRLDTWVYSPLCLAISALCAALLHSTN
jgi:hypothetical protein